MKKTYLFAAVWVLVVGLVLLCGTAMGRMFRQTPPLENEFDIAIVDCVVHEKLDGSGDFTGGEHEASRKTGITVKNTGNIDAFIRLRFVTYWVNGAGNIVARSAPPLTVTCTDSWTAGVGNTFYHKAPVAPGAFSGELLDGDLVLRSEDGYRQVVEVFADAIQSRPAEAVEEKWGVTVSADGVIQTVP